MMQKPKTLSAPFVKTINKAGRYGDGHGGHGLYLIVKPLANNRLSKVWAQRVRTGGKVNNLGLGKYPAVTLSKARTKARENAQAIAEGRDPRNKGIPTFQEAVEKVVALHRDSWKVSSRSEQDWRQSLSIHAFPLVGDRPVSQITTADILSIITPIWHEKHETAKRLLNRIGIIMRWAIAHGFRQDDPAHVAQAVLPSTNGHTKRHHPALPFAKVGGAIQKIRKADASQSTKLALEFLILTACRSGEVRGARWSEIDLEQAVWTIPGERMKAGKAHSVPLSDRCIDILRKAKGLSDDSGLVFPSSRIGKPLGDKALVKVLRAAEIKETVHGFRSSFRDWAAEKGVSREIAEAALAHIVGGVEGAYFRSDLFDQRAAVMHAWCDFVTH